MSEHITEAESYENEELEQASLREMDFDEEVRPPGYDTEWVRFLDHLTLDDTLSSILEYIANSNVTQRAKEKLMIYAITLFDKEFAVSRLESWEDYLRLLDKKHILDADLSLGLTRFDMTPEFHHIVNLIALKFDIKVRRSMAGGFERRLIATQRVEKLYEEKLKSSAAPKKGIGSKIKQIFT